MTIHSLVENGEANTKARALEKIESIVEIESIAEGCLLNGWSF